MPGQCGAKKNNQGWTFTGADQDATASHRKAIAQRHTNGGDRKGSQDGTTCDSIPRQMVGKAGKNHKTKQA
jgi:hypothetical protein